MSDSIDTVTNPSPEAPTSGWLQIGTSVWAILVAGIIILFMVAIAGPKLIESRLPGNESAAIGTLKLLKSSQQLYKEQGHANYASFSELQATALKGHYLEKNNTMQGYRFDCDNGKANPGEAWWASAAPIEPGKSGSRYFATNQSGNIYVSSKPISLNLDSAEIPASNEVKLVGQP